MVGIILVMLEVAKVKVGELVYVAPWVLRDLNQDKNEPICPSN